MKCLGLFFPRKNHVFHSDAPNRNNKTPYGNRYRSGSQDPFPHVPPLLLVFSEEDAVRVYIAPDFHSAPGLCSSPGRDGLFRNI